MKKKLNVGMIVTLSGRWPRPLPEKRFKEYGEWVEQNLTGCEVHRFERVVCTKQDMLECIDEFRQTLCQCTLLRSNEWSQHDAYPCTASYRIWK